MTTTTGSTVTRERIAAVLKHLLDGKPVEFIATAMRMGLDDVAGIGDAHGWPDRGKVRWALDELQKPPALPERAAPLVTSQQSASSSAWTAKPPARQSLSISTVAQANKAAQTPALVDTARAAAEHSKPIARALKAYDAASEKLDQARDALAAALDEHQAQATARARLAKLEAEAAALREQLRGGKPAKSAAASSDGPDPKAVRAWAAEHDVECPGFGRVPRRVIDAYLAAQVA